MIPSNPFLINGYNSPNEFCDRETESHRMREALRNGRNLTLISWRRMGKTGLIHHTFHLMGKEKDFSFFYVDLLPTLSLADFIREFSKAVLGKLDSPSSKIIKKIGTLLSHLRPTITYDNLTGEPSILFDFVESGTEKNTLEQIFTYLDSQNKKIVIALDEFQQILKYSETTTEALLRSLIQRTNNITFIFAGSRKHLLEAMFRDAGRPFYNSTEILFLEKIDAEEYRQFIRKKFKEGGKKISIETIEQLLEWCRNHTWYVQYVCNRLYSLSKNDIDLNILHQMMVTILNENEPGYYGYRNLITSFQWKVLNAIAQEKTLTEPNGKAFLTKYQLGAASSVSLAIAALLDKELIYRENEIFYVYDVFLSRWMERKI